MQSSVLRNFLAMIFILALAACTQAPVVPAPTQTLPPTPALTSTSSPTLTASPAPTQTPAPSPTPVPSATPALLDVGLSPRQYVTSGGFSLKIPLDGLRQVTERQVMIQDELGAITISFYGETDAHDSRDAGAIVADFIDRLIERTGGSYEKQPGEAVWVGGVEGQSFDISGEMAGFPFEGKAIISMANESQYLFGTGIAKVEGQPDIWKSQGQPLFDAILQTIEFSPTETDGQACQVSTDPSYGYTEENPIKVGGDWMDGPARERAFMDVLSGPNGEAVTYERNGSEMLGDIILDVYTVTIQGQSGTRLLYVDEYDYEQPLAPVGFNCSAPIPLSAP